MRKNFLDGVLERLKHLSAVFAIDICAYPVMSNHYHLVLHVDRPRAENFTREHVVEHWTKLFGMPALIGRWREGLAGESERQAAEQIIERWRRRLCDVSWYMRCLNEYLARRANLEDQCTGRFWEGRFKSQALLDEAGLLTAMAYVDLNPIRAGIATLPEVSEFTAIYARLQRLRPPTSAAATNAECEVGISNAPDLLAFLDQAAPSQPAIPLSFSHYLQLIDWTGRAIRPDKIGHIDAAAPPILVRLNIDPAAWQGAMRPAGNVFGRALGRLDHLRLHAKALGQYWIKGLRQARRLYPSS